MSAAGSICMFLPARGLSTVFVSGGMESHDIQAPNSVATVVKFKSPFGISLELAT
jgi:hypothetical protein